MIVDRTFLVANAQQLRQMDRIVQRANRMDVSSAARRTIHLAQAAKQVQADILARQLHVTRE